jgi:hypothetical protein
MAASAAVAPWLVCERLCSTRRPPVPLPASAAASAAADWCCWGCCGGCCCCRRQHALPPPTSSPPNEAAQETHPILELVTNRCRAEFGTHNTLLLGDYNVRLGDRNPIGGTPRFSEDGDKANRTALSNPIIKTFKNLELCPLMGREQGAPALVTSRSWAAGPGITPAPGKGAEVDYILGHLNSTPPYTVDPPLPWEAHPETCTHRTIGITITLLPATVYSSRPAIAAPSKRHLPLYSNNVAHAKVGGVFLDKLNTLVGPAPDDPALLFKAFNCALEEAIQAGTPSVRPPPPRTGTLTPWATGQ